MLRSLWITQSFTPLNIRMQLAKTYLIPSLLYGCEVFVNPDSSSMLSLTRLLNNIARYIFKKRKYERISLFTNQIFGMTLRNLINFRALVLFHRIIHSKEPPYLYERLEFSQSTRQRSVKPFHYTYSFSEQQFYVFTVRLWNSLPIYIRAERSATQFRKRLKIFYNQ